jgi:hypothetical protein
LTLVKNRPDAAKILVQCYGVQRHTPELLANQAG